MSIPLSKSEARTIRRNFASSRCNQHLFVASWIPSTRTVKSHSVSVTRVFSLPPDAVLVGVYDSGCPIHRLHRPHRPPANIRGGEANCSS